MEHGNLPGLGLSAYNQPFGRLEIALRLNAVQLQLLQRALSLAACPLSDKSTISEKVRTNNSWRLVIVSTDAAAVAAAQTQRARAVGAEYGGKTHTSKNENKTFSHFYDSLISQKSEDVDFLHTQPRERTVNIVNTDKIDNAAIHRLHGSLRVSPLPLPAHHWKHLTSPHTHLVALFEQSVAGALLLQPSKHHGLRSLLDSGSRHDLFRVLGIPMSSEMHSYRSTNATENTKGPSHQHDKSNLQLSMNLFVREPETNKGESVPVTRNRESDLIHRWQWLVEKADAFVGLLLGRVVSTHETTGWAAMWLQELVCHLSIMVGTPSLFSLRPVASFAQQDFNQIRDYRRQQHLATTKLLALALRHRLREIATDPERRYRPIADLLQRLVETVYQVLMGLLCFYLFEACFRALETRQHICYWDFIRVLSDYWVPISADSEGYPSQAHVADASIPRLLCPEAGSIRNDPACPGVNIHNLFAVITELCTTLSSINSSINFASLNYLRH